MRMRIAGQILQQLSGTAGHVRQERHGRRCRVIDSDFLIASQRREVVQPLVQAARVILRPEGGCEPFHAALLFRRRVRIARWTGAARMRSVQVATRRRRSVFVTVGAAAARPAQ